jgi:hypothetical protein
VAKLLQKKQLNFHRALAAGLGHGGIEAILIAGTAMINNLAYAAMINGGTFDQTLAAAAAGGVDVAQLELIREQLIASSPALFLLAVPTQPRVPLSTWVTSLKVAFGKLDTPEAQAMRSDTGIQLTPRLWEYMGWIPRMVELLQECRRIRKVIPLLTVPTQVFQSRVDELVSPRSCEDLSNPCMQTTILQNSGHFVYGPEDTALLQKCLLELLQSI